MSYFVQKAINIKERTPGNEKKRLQETEIRTVKLSKLPVHNCNKPYVRQ